MLKTMAASRVRPSVSFFISFPLVAKTGSRAKPIRSIFKVYPWRFPSAQIVQWRMSWGHGLIRQAISGQQATGVVNKLVVGEALREREKRGPLSLHNIPLINFAGRKWSDQHLHLVGLNLEKSESALTFLWFVGNDQPILSQGQKETYHLAIIISQPVEMLYIFDQQQQQKLHSPAHKLGFLLWRCFKFPKSLDLTCWGSLSRTKQLNRLQSGMKPEGPSGWEPSACSVNPKTARTDTITFTFFFFF